MAYSYDGKVDNLRRNGSKTKFSFDVTLKDEKNRSVTYGTNSLGVSGWVEGVMTKTNIDAVINAIVERHNRISSDKITGQKIETSNTLQMNKDRDGFASLKIIDSASRVIQKTNSNISTR